jgi:hypothetical protein
MGVPTSEVGYNSATTKRETTKSMTDMWWHWIKKIQFGKLNQTMSLSFRWWYILVCKNRVLRRIFGPKRDDVTGEWRKL